jgi:hypothetical protein
MTIKEIEKRYKEYRYTKMYKFEVWIIGRQDIKAIVTPEEKDKYIKLLQKHEGFTEFNSIYIRNSTINGYRAVEKYVLKELKHTIPEDGYNCSIKDNKVTLYDEFKYDKNNNIVYKTLDDYTRIMLHK